MLPRQRARRNEGSTSGRPLSLSLLFTITSDTLPKTVTENSDAVFLALHARIDPTTAVRIRQLFAVAARILANGHVCANALDPANVELSRAFPFSRVTFSPSRCVLTRGAAR